MPGAHRACPASQAHLPLPCPQLEQGPSLGPVESLDGPAGAVLECLVLESRMLVPELVVPVVYLLGALTSERPLGAGGEWEGERWAFPDGPSGTASYLTLSQC